jgi:hypothetical protein
MRSERAPTGPLRVLTENQPTIQPTAAQAARCEAMRHETQGVVFGKTFREFVWCCRCEQVHRRSLWEEKAWICPTPGCGANGVLAWPWEDVLPLCAEPDVVPAEDRRYPLAPPLARPVDPTPDGVELWPDPQCRIRDTLCPGYGERKH